ncbi:peptidoglycan recognition family protein [Streptomyces sp. NPDC091278]|uniref:peptidoglycan recognition protein family protein n=1 Tax=Streptomyces sp. NPDC091278 TaxID=3155301 RepID=UPI00344D391C
MASPLSSDRALAAFRKAGLTVKEVRSWRTRNRNHVGPWGPVHGVMIHHTGPYSSQSGMVSLCYGGYAALPGPLCHTVIDKAGAAHLVGWGRTNHAGSGDPDVLSAVIAERPLPPDNEATADGNRHFYGAELINRGDGEDPWPQVQVEAAVRWAAALCAAHGWDERSVIGHLEWQPGKPDPRGFSMTHFRARVAKVLAGGKPAPGRPVPAPPTRPVPKPPAYVPPPFPAGLRPGGSRPSAKELQKALRKGGFLDIADRDLSDVYGPRTQTGVARFHDRYPQYRAPGVRQDPAIGPKGWTALFGLAYGRR